MATKRTVVLNGDLGSGKSTVSIMLAERLGVRRVSVGDLYRALAAQLGMSAVEINLHAELDDKIDHYVDQLQRDIAASGEQLVVDSRLAWHFFADAVKVHLITDPTVAAHRVLGRPADDVESYASVEEARSRLAIRSESERVRFLSRYKVDKTRLRNYDLLCDSTRATPEQIVDKIISHLEGGSDGRPQPLCYLDPRRIYPTAEPARAGRPYDDAGLTDVAYVSPSFFALGSHRHLSAAIEAGATLVGARLVAEADMSIGAQSCVDYLHAHVTPSRIGAWEAAYAVGLPLLEPRGPGTRSVTVSLPS
jgi:predicted cytidylate kinase